MQRATVLVLHRACAGLPPWGPQGPQPPSRSHVLAPGSPRSVCGVCGGAESGPCAERGGGRHLTLRDAQVHVRRGTCPMSEWDSLWTPNSGDYSPPHLWWSLTIPGDVGIGFVYTSLSVSRIEVYLDAS